MTAGTATQTAASPLAAVPAPFMLITPERLGEIHAAMLRCHAIAERAGALVRAGLPARGLHAALGREAVYAGALVGLEAQDVLIASPRDAAAGILRGASPADLFAPFAPKKPERRKDPCSPPESGALPVASTPEAQLHLANGAALALKPHADKALAVALGELGAAADEAWKQALAFAAAETLPVLFVCFLRARKAADFVAAEARFNELHAMARTVQVPAIAVDASDAIAVYRVASESIARARMRRGPTLIACLLHPTEHVPDSGPRTGTADVFADALRGMESYLDRKGLFDPARKAKIAGEIARQLDRATRGLLR
ncbi:MAG TPA: thiamine pyrophosphate-dependent enzyme [Terracidiphilus sp.]|nr:thiamine pyrophosphate-dependent enzyme [Terracidiphilus sp.]